MTDGELDFSELDPNREATPERVAVEVDYVWELLVGGVEVCLEWYYDPQPILDSLAEKLGKTAVKKLLEEVEARGAVAEDPPF